MNRKSHYSTPQGNISTYRPMALRAKFLGFEPNLIEGALGTGVVFQVRVIFLLNGEATALENFFHGGRLGLKLRTNFDQNRPTGRIFQYFNGSGQNEMLDSINIQLDQFRVFRQ